MTESSGIQVDHDITQETVDLVVKMIELYCSRKGLSGPVWRPAPLLQKIDGAQILKERCNLEYPRLGKSEHFYSGVVISIEMLDHGGACLGFLPTTQPSGPHVPGVLGIFRLGNLQDWMLAGPDHDPQRARSERFDFILNDAITRAFRDNEVNLEGYRDRRFR